MKKRFNLIDALIIVCVALIVLSVIFRGQIISAFSIRRNLDSFVVTFESDPVDNRVLSTLKNGQSVTWVENGAVLGKLDGYSSEAAVFYTADRFGELVETESKDQSIIKGRMTVTAAYRDGSCYVSGTEFLGGGMQLTLRTEYATFTVTVISVMK